MKGEQSERNNLCMAKRGDAAVEWTRWSYILPRRRATREIQVKPWDMQPRETARAYEFISAGITLKSWLPRGHQGSCQPVCNQL